MNATGRAGEKLHAELPFQRLDLHAEGGLRHGQDRRGAAEMKLLSHVYVRWSERQIRRTKIGVGFAGNAKC